MTGRASDAASGRTNDAFDEKGCIVSRPEDFNAAYPPQQEDASVDPWAEHNAEVDLQNRIDAICRSLAGAIEVAAAELSELGLSGDDVGETIQSTWECSDWAESLHLDGCTLPGDHDGPCDV